ncbi:MAG: hypothetical protein LBK76_03960 [Verrucomicrobiales bacterium]|jgi:hypothetical protein|nr:hypothetical protein [Verrucomicrobiales bacterium]
MKNNGFLPLEERSLPPEEEALPVAEDILPSAEGVLPVAEDALPSAEKALPVAEDVLPTAEDALPVAEEALPRAEDALSAEIGAIFWEVEAAKVAGVNAISRHSSAREKRVKVARCADRRRYLGRGSCLTCCRWLVPLIARYRWRQCGEKVSDSFNLRKGFFIFFNHKSQAAITRRLKLRTK